MAFFIALRFLTIIPSPVRREVTAAGIGQSLPYFPLVGLLLGAVLLGSHYVLSLLLPPPVVIALIVAASVLLTGAHHLDGLMDTADGVFVSGKSREERLTIMADVRTGAFGTAAAIIMLLLKYVCLLAAPVLPALLLMFPLSRWQMVSALFAFPYARPSGMGVEYKQGASWQRLTAATLIAAAISLLVLGLWGLALMSVLWLLTLAAAAGIKARLGGLTGDTYGAINEMAEVLVLLLLMILY